MYGVFAAHACFHNMYTVIKNVVNLSQVNSKLMHKNMILNTRVYKKASYSENFIPAYLFTKINRK